MKVTIDCSPKELAALVRAATLPRETTVTMDTSRMNGILDSVAEAVDFTVMSAASENKSYKDIVINPDSDFRTLGHVLGYMDESGSIYEV